MKNQTHSPVDNWWKGEAAPPSLAHIVGENARRTPDKVVLAKRDGSSWTPVTAAEFDEQVTRLALGFVAAGVQPGDRVALMSRTRYEWTLVDFALWAAGAVVVPVYETSSAHQLQWILQDSGAVGCVVETRGHATALAGIRDSTPALRGVWVLDGGDGHAGLDDLVEMGARFEASELDQHRATLSRDSLATLIYTSGTTGRPKGCELTHGNFLAEVTSAIDALPELFAPQDASTLLFLPLAHVFGRMIQIAVVLHAVKLGHTDVSRITVDLPTFQPSFVLAVPRVFERVFDTAQRKAVTAGKGKVFEAAASTAIAWSTALESGRPGPVLSAKRALFDRLVYGKIKAAFGGRTQWAVSGGAALGPRLGHFFRGIGVTILEGYGLTETTAAITVNTNGATKVGTVGRALPGFSIRTSDRGEVLVKGGNVFRGYFNDPAATAAAFDEDGWFRTGDLGTIDADGYLTITGRSKEILVTSGGKNISPAPMEDVIRGHVLVSQAMVVGDGRKHVAALVTLDEESVGAWLDQHDRPRVPVAELVDDPQLLAEIQQAVDAANATVSQPEQIKKFRVLPVDFTEDGGHITPTLKLKRAVVMNDFADQVEGLYAPQV